MGSYNIPSRFRVGIIVCPKREGVKEKMSSQKQPKAEVVSQGRKTGEKDSEVIKRIAELVERAGKRVHVAAGIDVSESRISEFLSGGRPPSPEIMVKLAKLADRYGLPSATFFLDRAGVDRELLESVAAKTIAARSMLAGETQAISYMRQIEGANKEDRPIAVSREFISNLVSERWLDVSERLAGGPFKEGDVIRVERDHGDASEDRFHDYTVLAEFPAPRPGYRSFTLEGRAIGIFVRGAFSSSAVPMLEFLPFREDPGVRVPIGMFFSSTMRAASEAESWAATIAREDAELRRVQIIGKVTGWLVRPRHSENKAGD